MWLLPLQGASFGVYTNPGCRSFVALPWAICFLPLRGVKINVFCSICFIKIMPCIVFAKLCELRVRNIIPHGTIIKNSAQQIACRAELLFLSIVIKYA